MKKVGLFRSRKADSARVLRAAARVSSRGRRTDTRANSAATKKPFAPTKNNTAINFARTLRMVVECWAPSARRASTILAGSSIAQLNESGSRFNAHLSTPGARHHREPAMPQALNQFLLIN